MSQIQASFCYDGQEFGIVDEDTIVQFGGNAIVLFNVSRQTKDYIPCPRRNGYSCITTSYNNGLIAAAESGLNPSCQIYQMPSKRMVAEFKMKTTLKCMGMSFSRDGKYLVMIGGLPDFNISIYDLENKKFLVTEDLKLKCKNEFISVKFNPRNKNQFCILSQNKVDFYNLLPAFQFIGDREGGHHDDQSEGGQNNFLDGWRFNEEEFDSGDIPVMEGGDPKVSFTSLTWDSQNRILLCTNQNKLFHICSKNPHIGKTLDLESPPLSTILTPRHLIVSEENGKINWFRIEHPFENAKPEDKFVTIFDEIHKQYDFKEQLPEEVQCPAHFLVYSKSHQKMLIGTRNGILSTLACAAEKIADDEPDEEAQEEQKMQTISESLEMIGHFHTDKVYAVKPLGTSTQMVSISADTTITLWEVTTQQQLSVIHMPAGPISLDVTREGSVMFIGSKVGTFRIYDITNREKPRLISQLRFYDNEEVSQIVSSEDGKLVLIASKESETFFVMSQEASNGYEIYGHIKANGLIKNIGHHKMKDGTASALAILSNSLCESFCIPTSVYKNRLEPIPTSFTKSGVKKIDNDSSMLVSNQFSKHYGVVGDDLVLKFYEHYPDDEFNNIDWKKPAVKASIEMRDSHALGTTCTASSSQGNMILTGGRDGMIIQRSSEIVAGHDQFECVNTFSAHAISQGGVQCLSIDNSGDFVYSGGADGSIMITSLTHGSLPHSEIPFENVTEKSNVAKVHTCQPVPYEQLETYEQRMAKEFQKQNEERKKTFLKEIMGELNQIKGNLHQLLGENDNVTDIEKLDRDEFVIDVVKADELWKKGEAVCDDIRKKAELTSLTMQLLKERVKANTWDQMEIQSRGCKSIRSEKLIFNYGIRKRTPAEYRHLSHLMMQRKIELRQKIARMEGNLREVVDEAHFAGFENYLQNRVTGKPVFMDDDSIAEAARIFEETRARKLKEKNDKLNNMNMDQMEGNGKLKPILTITKGKLGTKTRKRDPEEEARLAALLAKNNQRDIKGMEEIHWQIVQTKRNIDDMKAALESQNIFEMLYEPYDLYPDKRKRIQIEFLKEVVFELKRDFNKEFEMLEKLKNDHIFSIGEKNDQIRDLLENLQREDNTEKFVKDLEERPDHIFEINEATEILVQRFYTKEQRAQQEEDIRKQKEKEALLQGDNIGQRGLTTMLGGNRLEFKKEKNKIDDELVREEWMNKPEGDMNDEERQKLREFEQRLKDSQDKQRKQWEVNLARVKQEITEIKSKFEEQLYQLYKKRIFYDARIYEQELQIIRLTIALHDVKETASNVQKYNNNFEEIQKKLEVKKEFVHICNDQYQEFDQRMKNDKAFQEQDQRVKSICGQQDLDQRKIKDFVQKGRPMARKQLTPEEVIGKKAHIVYLDPYHEIDLEVVKERIKEEEKIEQYDFNRDYIYFGDIMQEQFEQVQHERMMRIKMKAVEAKNHDRLSNLRDFIMYLENEKKDIIEKYEDVQRRFSKAVDRQEKLKFNFEVVTYLKQGKNEVPQLPVATDYKEAILVSQDVIFYENGDIEHKGKTKVYNMEEILKHKTKLKQIKYEVKKLNLMIEDYKERALDVQLYRVTKKTQEIIQGKYQKKDEEDKKRLESQIKQLEQNSTNRLKTFGIQKKKLHQEIKDKQRENSELESKARDLRMEVDQRQQIIDLKSATSNDTASDPKKRIMAIANQRKMIDVIKQQEEEIMFLKDELDRLRARTFPSFAHIQNKADYPDER